MRPVELSVNRLVLYVFSLLILWLAYAYLGSFYMYFFHGGIFLLFGSAVQAVFSLLLLRVSQNFSTNHPVKGQGLTCKLRITSDFILPTCRINLRFMAIQPGLSLNIPSLSIFLLPSLQYRDRFDIRCPFRGVYTVGLQAIEVQDIFGILTLRKPVNHRTFYVLPRVAEIQSPFPGVMDQYSSLLNNHGMAEDPSLFEGLREYRTGCSIRHMNWKKFHALGRPFLREFGRSGDPGISVYLDLRRPSVPTVRMLESEDCSVEIMVAFVKYCLDRHVPVRVRAPGPGIWKFDGDRPHQFPDFHRRTVDIRFVKNAISPLELYLNENDTESSRTVVFITHRQDSGVFDLAEKAGGTPVTVAAILNQSILEVDEKQRSRRYFRTAREHGALVYHVDGADSIAEDLRT